MGLFSCCSSKPVAIEESTTIEERKITSASSKESKDSGEFESKSELRFMSPKDAHPILAMHRLSVRLAMFKCNTRVTATMVSIPHCNKA